LKNRSRSGPTSADQQRSNLPLFPLYFALYFAQRFFHHIGCRPAGI